jgi:F0F1-type ATP synthase membrane subunit c/vacuolar-type H+-ATPase subunit K
VILSGQSDISEANGFKNLCAGLSVGLACLMSGIGMSNFLEKHMAPSRITSRNTRATTCCGDQQEPLISGDTQSYAIPPTSWSLIMVMVFLEAIGLYGLIVALILSSHDKQ